jgi:hypothetical protein
MTETDALARLERHERECAERYRETKEEMRAIRHLIDTRMDWLLKALIIMALASVVMSFIVLLGAESFAEIAKFSRRG